MSAGSSLTSIAAGRRHLALSVTDRQMPRWPDPSGTQRARQRLRRRLAARIRSRSDPWSTSGPQTRASWSFARNFPLTQRGAEVHQNVADYGPRDDVPGAQVDRCRPPARKDEHRRHPQERGIGWREVECCGSRRRRGGGHTVRTHDELRGAGRVRGDALSVGRVRPGDLRGAGEQEDRGPVRGRECLHEYVVDVLRCHDRETAVVGGEARAEVDERPSVPRPPTASAGVAVAAPPNMLSSAPSATITPNRLMAITPSAPPLRARCRAYRPAAGRAAVTIADLPPLPPVEVNVNTYFCGRHISATDGNRSPSSWFCSVLPVVAPRRFAARRFGRGQR